MAGGGKSGGGSDFLKNFPMDTGGPGTIGLTQGAPNPQAQMAPQGPPHMQAQPMAPWMQQLGGMGQGMMQAGQRPPLQAPVLGHHPQMGTMAGMTMPQPLMQPMSTQDMNQLLSRHIGLMGNGRL